MSKSIKFTASGSSSVLGNFAPGDIARNIPDAMAAHLVNEALCAKYLPDAPPPETKEAPEVKEDQPAKRGRPPKIKQ